MDWNDQMIDDELQRAASSDEAMYPADIAPSAFIWKLVMKKRKRRRTLQLRKMWAAAAVLLLISTASVWYGMKQNNALLVKNKPEAIPVANEEHEALAYIQRLSTGGNIACQSPAFIELKKALEDSFINLADVNEQIALFGENEQLTRAKARIENHRARIVKSMLQML